ncbi:MAG: hypothetical protein LBN42_04460 [Oscillospiraceae bacterium]|nr:hypothetical protein [Oscillospiraceae bacterium]
MTIYAITKPVLDKSRQGSRKDYIVGKASVFRPQKACRNGRNKKEFSGFEEKHT